MPRLIIHMLFVVAVVISGIFPHVAMADEQQYAPNACHAEHRATVAHLDAVNHCGAAEHTMSPACAAACLGSIAVLDVTIVVITATFVSPVHLQKLTNTEVGREAEAAERPPQSI